MVESQRTGRRAAVSPLQRLVTIMTLLAEAPAEGVWADDLVAAGGYGGAIEGRREQLQRDLRHLASRGWHISNAAAAGGPARYRLAHGDPRVNLHLSAQQRVEFARAAALVGVDSVRVMASLSGRDAGVKQAMSQAPGYSLALATHGHEHRCLIRFRYRDKDRVVSSDAIWLREGRWYLVGRELGGPDDADGPVAKQFRLDRMSELTLDRPGTAGPVEGTPTLRIDPLTFPEGDPVDAIVATDQAYRARVEDQLGRATGVTRTQDRVTLTIPVVSHTTFRNRLYELGTRVTLVGPPALRDEVAADLRAHLLRGR